MNRLINLVVFATVRSEKPTGVYPFIHKLFDRNFIGRSNVRSNLQLQLRAQFAHTKSAVVEEYRKPLVVREVKKKKKLQANEVHVAVHSCGVNNSDLLISQGEYAVKIKLPFVPGFEIAGEVVSVGSEVVELSPGERVIGLSKESFSGFAEDCILEKKDLWRVPQSMSFEVAAALADSYSTALLACRRANLKPGDTVLVTAAAGGLGLAAVDLTANVFKAKVIGACSTEDKAALVREKGAFSALNYSDRELMKEVMKHTNDTGVKIIFDAVGGEIFEDCLNCVAHEGSVIVAGFASRQVPKISTSQLLPKSCALIGVSLSHYRSMANQVYRDTVQEVIDMYNDQYIEPHISTTFDLDEVNEAFKYIEDRKSTGKVVLNIR